MLLLVAASCVAQLSPLHLWAQPEAASPKELPFYFSLGYVSKDWVADGAHKDFWQQPDRRLHGYLLGVGYMQPLTRWGLGIQAEVNYENYRSYGKPVRDRDWFKFSEHSLHVPLHLVCDIVVGDVCHLLVTAGAGVNWAVLGCYSDAWYVRLFDDKEYADRYFEKASYGKGNAPQRLNLQSELGIGFRYKKIMLGVQYGRGLNNHHWEPARTTRQDRIEAKLSLLLDEKDVGIRH